LIKLTNDQRRTNILIVLYHQQARQANKMDLAKREKELADQKKKFNIGEAVAT
jgi:hypothetical protein